MLLQHNGLSTQFGAHAKMGCRDVLFSLRSILQLHKTHDQESWVLFVDLIKAFDTARHDLLVPSLTRFGAPPCLAHLVRSLYSDMTVEFRHDKETIEIDYTCGVRQGNHMAPLVCLFYMQAAMGLVSPCLLALGIEPLCFKHPICREPGLGRLNGQRVASRGVSFQAGELLYVDDGAFMFSSWHDLVVALGVIKTQFAWLGLLMHVGVGDRPSKSVVMFIPNLMSLQIPVGGKAKYSLPSGGCIHFVREFRYLGSLLSWDLTDTPDLQSRIRSATHRLHLMLPLLRSKLLPMGLKESSTWLFR